jgi:hypothetical protein
MGLNLNHFIQNLLFGVIFLFILAVIIVIKLIFLLSRARSNSVENCECLTCKDDILKEFKHIRHEYNNMLQGLLCTIEEGDWSELMDYKETMLERTQKLNRSNLTQLVRIKDKSILRLIYGLLVKAGEAGITINLNIYSDLEDMNVYKNEVVNALQAYISYAYELATSEALEVELKINANEQGLRFAFENKATSKSCNFSHHYFTPLKAYRKCKNLFFNSYIQNDYLVQEILFSK